MAILNSSMFRGARKQAGGWVLYKVGGQTIAREVASQVSNPRTPAQMDNRVRLQNVVSVYRANRGWMKGAFENKKQKESDYNAFVSANLSSSQVAFTKEQAAAGAAVAAPYKISSGSLGSIEQSVTGSVLETNLFLGNMDITPGTTVGEFSTALINNNNNIVQGMQLSLILNIQQVNSATGIPYIITRAYEVQLNPSSTELLSAYMPGSILSAGSDEGSPLTADLSDSGNGAASFILSHTVSATTRVSEQSLLMYGSLAVYNSYTSAQAIAEAVASYGENEINFLDSNSAKEQNDVPIQQSITMCIIAGSVVRPGQTLAAELQTGNNYRAVLAQPDTELTITNSVLRNLTDDTTTGLAAVEVATDGSNILFRVQESVTVESNKQMRLVFVTSAGNLMFDFTLAPAS